MKPVTAVERLPCNQTVVSSKGEILQLKHDRFPPKIKNREVACDYNKIK